MCWASSIWYPGVWDDLFGTCVWFGALHVAICWAEEMLHHGVKKNTGIGIYMKHHVSPYQKTSKNKHVFVDPCQLVTVAGFLLVQTISLNDGRHLLCTSPESLWRFRWCHSPQGYNLHLGIPRVRQPGTKKHVQLSPQCRHHLKNPHVKVSSYILTSIISSPPNKKNMAILYE